MARPLRIEYPGAVYHVTSRGNARQPIFKDPRDRTKFLDILASVNHRYHWICHAYCLMDNHYHLVIETPDGNLARGMRQVNGVYTQAYNWRHHRVGHIFQGRYKAIIVDKDSYLLDVCRYVVLNPVRAKVVCRPAQWPWSSYNATAGVVVQAHRCLTVDWVLSQFSARPDEARRRYRDFVNDGTATRAIYDQVKGQIFLGDEEFISKLEQTISKRDEICEVPREQRYADRPQLSALFAGKRLKIKAKTREAVERYGYTQKAIADHLGLHYSTISRWLSSGNSRFKT